MNPKRTALALLAVASLGISACGSSSSTPDGVKANRDQIVKRAAEIRHDAAERNARAVASTKDYADKAIEDAKSKTTDPATRKAMDDVEKSLVEVPVPTAPPAP